MVSIVENFVKALTRNPDAVNVRYEDQANVGLFHISVDKADVGRVIGQKGKTIQALDTLVTAINAYDKENYVLKVNEGDR